MLTSQGALRLQLPLRLVLAKSLVQAVVGPHSRQQKLRSSLAGCLTACQAIASVDCVLAVPKHADNLVVCIIGLLLQCTPPTSCSSEPDTARLMSCVSPGHSQSRNLGRHQPCCTLKFCNTSACTLLVLWQYFQISKCAGVLVFPFKSECFQTSTLSIPFCSVAPEQFSFFI